MLLPAKQGALGTIGLETCDSGSRKLGVESKVGGWRVSLSKLSSDGDLALFCAILQWVPRERCTQEILPTGHLCHAGSLTPCGLAPQAQLRNPGPSLLLLTLVTEVSLGIIKTRAVKTCIVALRTTSVLIIFFFLF